MKQLKTFFILWITQSLSALGSAMTTFALTLRLYEQTGSALKTALLSVCSYAPYIIMSIFAGALSDRWNKKATMLVCDSFAALCTLTVLILLKADALAAWHLYLLNALNGLMNTVQQPAAETSMTLIIPKKYYQQTSGMRSLSRSLTTILNPIIATAVFSLLGIEAVIYIDLATFALAFIALLFFVKIPEIQHDAEEKEPLLHSAAAGLRYLKANGMILTLIIFMSGINLVASAFDAVLPAFVLSAERGSKAVLSAVSSCSGIAMLVGSLMVSAMKPPKNRVKVIYITMLISMSVENFVMAFTSSPILWCIGQFIGWLPVPIMSANLDVIMRLTVPVEMQGRVYSCRNTLQFFT
ncbi:MAG: MFS transporter, partial [Oscillospiraceae bacterium]